MVGESELQDRLQDERRHKLVEKFSCTVHLVAPTDDGGQDFKDLLGHEVIIWILFQTIDAVLQNLTSE